MTKINDLATVTYSSLVRNIPEQEERYELLSALGTWCNSDINTVSRLHGTPAFCNERFTYWFKATQENVRNGAAALKLSISWNGEVTPLSPMTKDRAIRFVESFETMFSIRGQSLLHLRKCSLETLCGTFWYGFQRYAMDAEDTALYVVERTGRLLT